MAFKDDLLKKGTQGNFYISETESGIIYKVEGLIANGKIMEINRTNYFFNGSKITKSNFSGDLPKTTKNLSDCLDDLKVPKDFKLLPYNFAKKVGKILDS